MVIIVVQAHCSAGRLFMLANKFIHWQILGKKLANKLMLPNTGK